MEQGLDDDGDAFAMYYFSNETHIICSRL